MHERVPLSPPAGSPVDSPGASMRPLAPRGGLLHVLAIALLRVALELLLSLLELQALRLQLLEPRSAPRLELLLLRVDRRHLLSRPKLGVVP